MYSTNGMSTIAGQPASQISQPGISTELNQLFDAVVQNRSLAESIRSALGISYPTDPSEKEPDSSMASAIRVARLTINRTNDQLSEIVQYIQN